MVTFPNLLESKKEHKLLDLISHWEDLYDNAYQKGQDKFKQIRGVACAFHSVIDGFIPVKPDMIQPVLDKNPSLREAAIRGCRGQAPSEIITPEDFIEGLFYSLYRGSAMQRMIRSKETYEWALRTFGPGELRLGGTSGNMARALAPLQIPVTVYANPLTKELANLFGDHQALSVIQKNGTSYYLTKPQDAADEEGIFAIHWIFEYGTDFKMELDGIRIHPNRANRYIPSWNPRNNQFKMNEMFRKGFLSLSQNYDYLLFSGFHILSENYPDGKTCFDVIRPLSDYIREIKESAPGLKIHLELASIASPLIRKTIVELIMPHVHSVGLNETELPLMLEALRSNLGDDLFDEMPTSLDYAQACATLMRETGVKRVHFHNLGYYLCLENEPIASPEDSRNALLFASIMAAARAQNGLFTHPEDIAEGLSTAVSPIGINELSHLAHDLNQTSIAKEGLGKIDDYYLAAVPTKLVEKPLFTVGLGDTISSGALLAS